MRVLAWLGILALLLSACSTPPAADKTPTPEATVSSPTPAAATPANPVPGETPAPAESPQAQEKDWKLFTAEDGSFEVLLPGPAEAASSTRETDVTDYSVTTTVGKSVYSVNYTDYPDAESAQQARDERLSDIRAHSEGRLTAEETTSLDGREGVMFVLEEADGDEFRNAIFLVDSRLYDILIVPEDGTDVDSTAADRMVESFKFKS